MGQITTEYDKAKCLCCGLDHSNCECPTMPGWLMDENGEVVCSLHHAELMTRKALKTIGMNVPDAPRKSNYERILKI